MFHFVFLYYHGKFLIFLLSVQLHVFLHYGKKIVRTDIRPNDPSLLAETFPGINKQRGCGICRIPAALDLFFQSVFFCPDQNNLLFRCLRLFLFPLHEPQNRQHSGKKHRAGDDKNAGQGQSSAAFSIFPVFRFRIECIF